MRSCMWHANPILRRDPADCVALLFADGDVILFSTKLAGWLRRDPMSVNLLLRYT